MGSDKVISVFLFQKDPIKIRARVTANLLNPLMFNWQVLDERCLCIARRANPPRPTATAELLPGDGSVVRGSVPAFAAPVLVLAPWRAPPPESDMPRAAHSRSPPPPARTHSARALLLLAALAAAALLPVGGHASSPTMTEVSDCHGVPAQSALNLDKGPTRATASTTACPKIDLGPAWAAAPDVRMRLRWHENHHHVSYNLRLPEPETHKGYWLVDQPQNGSLTTNERYRQFEGAVMVMKATATHVVLTFCGNPGAERQVYSVVMAREPSLPKHDLASVNSMLWIFLQTFLITHESHRVVITTVLCNSKEQLRLINKEMEIAIRAKSVFSETNNIIINVTEL
ncbi:Uncharacterized protein GBIM_00305 [Gryllus bimaculatus]|nr:Uncharacterized protein GBIM_00305 [Gryllus bimaculatus]